MMNNIVDAMFGTEKILSIGKCKYVKVDFLQI